VTKPKLTRGDWLAEALEVMSSEGVGGVRVLSLAKSLGVTRGSFHWHFKDRDEFLGALLEYWRLEMTESVIEYIERIEGEPPERVRELAHFVVRTGRTHYDPAVRAWALADPMARDVVQGVDERRVRYVAGLFEQVGFSPEEAVSRGGMIVVYLMGEGLILQGRPLEERLRLLDRQLALVLESS
jgi:AcrR family transcriptional regulator